MKILEITFDFLNIGLDVVLIYYLIKLAELLKK